MRDNGKGTVVITGKFKETRHSDFQMFLTTNVDNADFNLGYCVTGTLEQGDRDSGELQLTHFAMIKRKAYQSC